MEEQNKKRQLIDCIIAFDFDGTLFVEDWPRVGKPITEMHWLIKQLHQKGFIIVINTARASNTHDDAKRALNEHNIEYDLFNENPKYRTDVYGDNPRKIAADVFIDDRNIGGLPTSVEALYWCLHRYEERKAANMLSDKLYLT